MSGREILGVYTHIAWRLNIFKCLFFQLQTIFPDLKEEGGMVQWKGGGAD